jgi:hypothetical protein
MASLKDFGSVGSGLGAANRAVTTPYDFGGWPLFGLEDILTGGCSEMCFGGSGVIIRSDCAGRFFYLFCQSTMAFLVAKSRQAPPFLRSCVSSS